MYTSERHLFYYPWWERKLVSMNSDPREIQRKLRVLEHADKIGGVTRALSKETILLVDESRLFPVARLLTVAATGSFA